MSPREPTATRSRSSSPTGRGARPPRATARGARSARRSPRDGRSPPSRRTAPARGASGSGAGQVGAALVCRPSAGFGALWARRRAHCGGRRDRARPRPVEHVGRARGPAAAQGLPAHPAGPQPRPRADRVPVRGRAFPGVPRLAGYAEVVTRDAGVSTVAMLQEFVGDGRGRVRADRGVPRGARRGARLRQPRVGDRGRGGPGHAHRGAPRGARDAAARRADLAPARRPAMSSGHGGWTRTGS